MDDTLDTGDDTLDTGVLIQHRYNDGVTTNTNYIFTHSFKITPRKFSLFISTLCLVYIIDYVITLQLGWEIHKKSLAKHYTDLFLMGVFSTLIYIFANMQETFTIYTVIGICIGTVGIAVVGNLPGFNFDVDSLKQVGVIQIIVVAFFLCFLCIMIGVTLKQYEDKHSLIATLAIVSIPLIIILFSYLIYLHETKINKNKQEYHFHHWQWSIPFIFLFRVPRHFISSFTSGILIGIFVDGISRYGPDSIYSE